MKKESKHSPIISELSIKTGTTEANPNNNTTSMFTSDNDFNNESITTFDNVRNIYPNPVPSCSNIHSKFQFNSINSFHTQPQQIILKKRPNVNKQSFNNKQLTSPNTQVNQNGIKKQTILSKIILFKNKDKKDNVNKTNFVYQRKKSKDKCVTNKLLKGNKTFNNESNINVLNSCSVQRNDYAMLNELYQGCNSNSNNMQIQTSEGFSIKSTERFFKRSNSNNNSNNNKICFTNLSRTQKNFELTKNYNRQNTSSSLSKDTNEKCNRNKILQLNENDNDNSLSSSSNNNEYRHTMNNNEKITKYKPNTSLLRISVPMNVNNNNHHNRKKNIRINRTNDNDIINTSISNHNNNNNNSINNTCNKSNDFIELLLNKVKTQNTNSHRSTLNQSQSPPQTSIFQNTSTFQTNYQKHISFVKQRNTKHHHTHIPTTTQLRSFNERLNSFKESSIHNNLTTNYNPSHYYLDHCTKITTHNNNHRKGNINYYIESKPKALIEKKRNLLLNSCNNVIYSDEDSNNDNNGNEDMMVGKCGNNSNNKYSYSFVNNYYNNMSLNGNNLIYDYDKIGKELYLK